MNKTNNFSHCILVGLTVLNSLLLKPQTTYDINSNIPEQKIYSGHLKLGGINPKGESLSVNNYYISVDNKPVITFITGSPGN